MTRNQVVMIPDYESRVVRAEDRLQLDMNGIMRAYEEGKKAGMKALHKAQMEALNSDIERRESEN